LVTALRALGLVRGAGAAGNGPRSFRGCCELHPPDGPGCGGGLAVPLGSDASDSPRLTSATDDGQVGVAHNFGHACLRSVRCSVLTLQPCKVRASRPMTAAGQHGPTTIAGVRQPHDADPLGRSDLRWGRRLSGFAVRRCVPSPSCEPDVVALLMCAGGTPGPAQARPRDRRRHRAMLELPLGRG